MGCEQSPAIRSRAPAPRRASSFKPPVGLLVRGRRLRVREDARNRQHDAEIEVGSSHGAVMLTPRVSFGVGASLLDDDRLQVFARHDHRRVVAAVEFANQVAQILFETELAILRQAGERPVHRTVPGAEHIDPVIR